MSLWNQLIDQQQAQAQLAAAAQEEKPTHAWLLTGPAGAGQATAALCFAAALLCDQPDPATRACGSCRSCQSVLKGSHADLLHFKTEKSSISIEEARDFVIKAQDRPAVGRWRVILIEDADRMPERTSNVLLKALEEPPPYTIWILTAPSAADVLITIRSRCRPIRLRQPSLQALSAHLQTQAKLSYQEADLLARLAQGNLERALQLAEDPQARKNRDQAAALPLNLRSVSAAMEAANQLLTLAEEEAQAQAQARHEQEEAALLASLGYSPGEKLSPTHRAQLRQLEEDQKRRSKRIQTDTLDRFLADLQTFFRDVLTVQLASGAELINLHLTQEIRAYSQAHSSQASLAHLERISTTRRRIRTNANARLAFEALITSLITEPNP